MSYALDNNDISTFRTTYTTESLARWWFDEQTPGVAAKQWMPTYPFNDMRLVSGQDLVLRGMTLEGPMGFAHIRAVDCRFIGPSKGGMGQVSKFMPVFGAGEP